MEKKYKELSRTPYEYADLIYRYAQIAVKDDYMLDYGTGELYTHVEVHTVSLIEDNPGITASEIADRNYRTKGAVSQILNKLEEKSLIRREKDSHNGRRTCLYVTPKGLELSRKHKEYDDEKMGDVLEEWISLFGYEAVEKYALLIEHYITHSYPKFLEFCQKNGTEK